MTRPRQPVALPVYERPDLLPARVVYTTDGRLIPAPVTDIRLPPMETATVSTVHVRGARKPNGLTIRADSMARMVANNVPIAEAFRTAYAVSPHVKPKDVTSRAARITRNQRFGEVVAQYKRELEGDSLQTRISTQVFVTGRLVHEAQHAKQDGARVRALELLGKTASMFTDVKRIETFTSGDVDKLKSQLNQRLTELVARLGLASSPSQGDEQAVIPLLPAGDPTGPAPPALREESHGSYPHINPPVQNPVPSDPGNLPIQPLNSGTGDDLDGTHEGESRSSGVSTRGS